MNNVQRVEKMFVVFVCVVVVVVVVYLSIREFIEIDDNSENAQMSICKAPKYTFGYARCVKYRSTLPLFLLVLRFVFCA